MSLVFFLVFVGPWIAVAAMDLMALRKEGTGARLHAPTS
ncbi:hypothetical protein GMJLKIPL_0565 [Methylobacterium isbiliense]|jgi:hypothetical protein|uniref:Uncharacterized protein n=1 Tax=Methylobacterium isbiliense TaxID=315478 RepID=A0ABQ4S9W1_9HYPH|nr:hypothetical protein GMJLKIPL_0565 [Methylobacterium isbiliense]